MSIDTLKKAPKAATEEAMIAFLDKHFPMAEIGPNSSTFCNRFVAEDVAEKAAFERGDVGEYTQQDVYTLLLCFEVLPQGTIMVGCGDTLYVKEGDDWSGVHRCGEAL